MFDSCIDQTKSIAETRQHRQGNSETSKSLSLFLAADVMERAKILPLFYTFGLMGTALNLLLAIIDFYTAYFLVLPPNRNFSANIYWVMEYLDHFIYLFLILHFLRLNEKFIYLAFALSYLVNVLYRYYSNSYWEFSEPEQLTLLLFVEKALFWSSVLCSVALIYRDSGRLGWWTVYGVALFASQFCWWMFSTEASWFVSLLLDLLYLAELVILGVLIVHYARRNNYLLVRTNSSEV